MKDTVHVYGDRLDGGRHVHVDGELLTPEASQAVYNHSPDGFEWGYGGSGPAQLALAILLAAGLAADQALRFHQAFKADHVAKFPQRAFRVEIDLAAWLKRAGRRA